MTSSTKWKLSSLLQIANLCIGLLAIHFYNEYGENEYVNSFTIYLTCFFALENILMLAHEKRNPDPLLLILLLLSTLFYLTRIPSLLYDPWSLVLFRYPFTVDNLNHALLFICASNVAIYLGLKLPRGKIAYKAAESMKYKPARVETVCLILGCTLLINFSFVLGIEALGRIANFIAGIFLNTYAILLLSITYLIVNYKQLSRQQKTALYLLLTAFVVVVTLFGARSAFLTILLLTVFAALSVNAVFKVSTSMIAAGMLVLPIAIAGFVVATYLRELSYGGRTIVDVERIALLGNLDMNVVGDDAKLILRPILDRIGYLTYAAEIISNGKEYSKVINFEYYMKSVIDNALTPGFNVFDTPKAANALRYIYLDIKANPTHKDVIAVYTSDQFSLYGEYFILFGGYPALLFMFLGSYVFKRAYLAIRAKDVFLFHLYRALVLLVFHNWLISFGADWMVVEFIGLIIPILIWQRFYKMRKSE